MEEKPKKIRVGILCITMNPPYWEYAKEMLEGLNRFFLKKHDIKDKYSVEMMLWSDIPENPEDIKNKIIDYTLFRGEATASMINQKEFQVVAKDEKIEEMRSLIQGISEVKKLAKIFTTEPVEWPLPTLLRYNLFLQQEEYINNFDYLFYIDVDMRITDWIGEEILGNLVAAQHPMYALRRNLIPPYEPNPDSTAYIPRPGRIVEEGGKKRFEPLYYAGGFQGGKTEDFIKAMKVMRERIEQDFNKNYIAIWNDESHWNKYLFEVPPTVVLDPSFVCPDSLIAQYYVKTWGRNYSPKIMTLTKRHTVNKEEGEAVNQLMMTM